MRPYCPPRWIDRECCVCFEIFTGNPMRRICKDCRPEATHVSVMASVLVRQAVRKGALAPPESLLCIDCGAPAWYYDHRDYSKPLQVEPVCARCNRARGPAKYPPPGTFAGFALKPYRAFTQLG